MSEGIQAGAAHGHAAAIPEVSPVAAAQVAEAVRVWLGLARAQAALVPAMPSRLQRLFLRSEEYTHRHRDRWGNWEHTFSENYHDGRLWQPEVNQWLHGERVRLQGEGVELAPLWPEGRPFAVCVTHDVDFVSEQRSLAQRWREVAKNGRLLSPREPDSVLALAGSAAALLLRPSNGLPSLRRTIEAAAGVVEGFGGRSSFFFTVYPLPRTSKFDCTYQFGDGCNFRGRRLPISSVMTELASGGFDIGLHGSIYSCRDPSLLRQQRLAVEAAAGVEVTTTRQHFLNFDVESTPSAQAAAGLQADSTLGFNRNVGFRSGVALPYRWIDAKGGGVLPVLQVPLIAQDTALLSQGGLELDLEMACRTMQRLMDAVRITGGCMTVLFHPDALVKPGYLELFKWTLSYAREGNGWLASLRQVYEWWQDREAALG